MTDNTDSPQRNLIVSEFLTLDGVMEAPEEWSSQFFSEEQETNSLGNLADLVREHDHDRVRPERVRRDDHADVRRAA